MPGGRTIAQESYNALISARLFAEAEKWASRHPEDVEPIQARILLNNAPSDRSRHDPAAIMIDTSNQNTTLRKKTVDIRTGQWIVGIVHPDCGFSRQAMEALDDARTKEPGLEGWKPLWLTGQKDLIPLRALAEWNKNRDFLELAVPYDIRAWPRSIDFSETPVFYIIKDGEVVNELRGWTDDEQKDRLLRLVQESDGL